MKAAISGSRTFNDYEFMSKCFDKVRTALDGGPGITEIWAGGAKGADALAIKLAAEKGVPFHEIKADWAKYGRAAGPRRNADLVAATDILIAFPVGESKGTRGCIQLAKKAAKRVFVFEPEP